MSRAARFRARGSQGVARDPYENAQSVDGPWGARLIGLQRSRARNLAARDCILFCKWLYVLRRFVCTSTFCRSSALYMRSVFGKNYREHGSTKCVVKVLRRAISREWRSISLDTSTHKCVLSTFECASSALTRGMAVRELRELRYGTSQRLSP